MSDRECTFRQYQLSEYGSRALDWKACDCFVEVDEAVYIVGDDAYGY